MNDNTLEYPSAGVELTALYGDPVAWSEYAAFVLRMCGFAMDFDTGAEIGIYHEVRDGWIPTLGTAEAAIWSVGEKE